MRQGSDAWSRLWGCSVPSFRQPDSCRWKLLFRDSLRRLPQHSGPYFVTHPAVSAARVCYLFNFKLNFNIMNKVTMLEFRKDAQSVLRRVARGERFVLSHRGRPVARLEPIAPAAPPDRDNDPFLGIPRRAVPSPKAKTRHQDIDRILYDHP